MHAYARSGATVDRVAFRFCPSYGIKFHSTKFAVLTQQMLCYSLDRTHLVRLIFGSSLCEGAGGGGGGDFPSGFRVCCVRLTGILSK